MAELGADIYGNSLEELAGEDDFLGEDGQAVTPSQESSDNGVGEEEAELRGEGEVPGDAAAAQKYWATAYHKSREKDRTKYSKMTEEHQQYTQVLSQFYKDDDYALRVIAERFPQLATSLQQGNGQAARAGSASSPGANVTETLRQHLGEFGFLADKLAPALTELIDAQVRTRVAPLQQQSTRQVEEARNGEMNRLLADMDTKYPGWEDKHGKSMEALHDFLQSDILTHPTFGNKYELLYRLVNPDVARIEASRVNLTAARRRSGMSQGGTNGQPNLEDAVRKADSRSSAFRLAAQGAIAALRQG